MIPSAVHPDPPSSLVERLADEMAGQWRAGARPLAEEFLARCPGLRDCRATVLDLLAEELALREEYDECVSANDLADRFPELASQVRALVECQRVLGLRPAPPELPVPGETLGEFRLVAELGRGAVGRVFLATQSSLAGRPVVLKVAPDRGQEHLTLARLQHTHIVPLFSAHEFPGRRLRALCLPYFGGGSLADLMATAAASRQGLNGAELLSVLRQVQAAAPMPFPVGGPACAFLEQASHAEAVCWIGACLADALQYAHDRNLLHLDLKPSNVLIAADGMPMLLDFHLARPPLRAGDPPPAWLGGTPGFTAPEHDAALREVQAGQPVPADVDGRADVYSLGRLMSAALQPTPVERPRTVAVGLSDILARCTANDAADRYPTAAALAADLRRHLTDLPLKGVRNRSLTERWRKWRRRRPHALPLVLAVAALAAACGGWFAYANRQASRAQFALREGEELLARGQYPEAVEAFRGGEALIGDLPFRRELAERLHGGRRRAERGLAAAELHRLVERVRPLYGAEVVAPNQVRSAATACRELWARRDVLAQSGGQLPPELVEQWRADLLDLGILTAHLTVRTTMPERARADREEALEILGQAETLLASSAILYHERATHARELGLSQLADDSARLTSTLPARSAWDHLAIGRVHLSAGDTRRAADELDQALNLDPSSTWANYYRGLCSLKQKEPGDAIATFSACLATTPRSQWCWYNRGLAFAEAGRLDRARADFDRALELDPHLVAALLSRAAVSGRAGHFTDGFADLRRAEGLGAPPAEVEYQRATLHLAAGDRQAALTSLRAGLAMNPDHSPSRDLLARLQSER